MNQFYNRINSLTLAYASKPTELMNSDDYQSLKKEYTDNEKGLIYAINSANIKTEKDILELIKQFAGGVSNPSKMPWYSWSTPMVFCKTGSKLAKLENTTCSKCYAEGGNYRRPNVRAALLRRYMMHDLSPSVWFHAFNRFFQYYAKDNTAYFFRWFDSGDIASPRQGELIAKIAANNPHIKFWLPTREQSYLSKFIHPQYAKNLIVRYSSPMIDTLSKTPNSTGVVSNARNLSKSLQIVGNRDDVGYCPATTTNEHTCNAHQCRACWEPGHVLYQLH